MSRASLPTRSEASRALPLALAAAIIATGKVADAVLPIGQDQGLFITIGQLIERGGMPWRDIWENKPPGVYYLYAAVLAFFPDYAQKCVLRLPVLVPEGLYVSCAQYGLAFVDWLWAVATAAAVGWFALHLFGRAEAAVATVAFALFSSMVQVAQGGSMPDGQVLLPTAVAMCAALRFADTRRGRWLVVAGLASGMALLFKQTGGLVAAAIAAWLVLDAPLRACGWRGAARVGAERTGLLVSGVLVVWLPVGLALAAAGALAAFLDQTIFWYRSYVAPTGGVVEVARLAASQSWKVFQGSQAALWLGALSAAPLLRPAARDDARVWLLVAWTASALASVAAGGARFHQYYYLVLVPPFSVLTSFGLTHLWRQVTRTWRIYGAVCALGVLLLSSQLQAQWLLRVWYTRIQSWTWGAEEFVAADASSGPAGPMLVWGYGSQIYALSGRLPAVRFAHPEAALGGIRLDARGQANRAEIISTLRAQPPPYIAVAGPEIATGGDLTFPELTRVLADLYTPGGRSGDPVYRGWKLYVRT